MLLKLTGSSCAGKSTLARSLADHPELVVRDFDEIGVPESPDTCWRHRANEWWVRQVLAYERQGRHLLLAGQSPLGEVLATPSATELDGIAICLVDVTDEIRIERLRKRDGARSTPETERDYLRWAAWHRHHARDPQYEPSVIRGTCADAVWNRWTGWSKGDPRWDLAVIDTSGVSVADATACLMAWVDQQLGLWRDGALSLGQGWLAGPRDAAK